MSIAVSIVEDDPGVRSSLVKLINSSPGYRCVSQHSSAESALDEIPKLKPDVTLMDINLPGINGVECVRKLKPMLPRTQVIMLTVYQNTDNIFKALAAGATGYMLKQTPPAELLAAIRDVNAGGSPMSGHIARKIVQSFQKPATAAAAGRVAFAARGGGAGSAGQGISLQGNRRPDENFLRHRPHPHPARLRETSCAVAHRGGGQALGPDALLARSNGFLNHRQNWRFPSV